MRHAARVHQLHNDATTPGMHRIGDVSPSGNLLLGVHTRHAKAAFAERAGRGALGDNQSPAGALRVVQRRMFGRRAVGGGTTARHRRHDKAIGHLQLTGL